jgi:hypothetical protein
MGDPSRLEGSEEPVRLFIPVKESTMLNLKALSALAVAASIVTVAISCPEIVLAFMALGYLAGRNRTLVIVNRS